MSPKPFPLDVTPEPVIADRGLCAGAAHGRRWASAMSDDPDRIAAENALFDRLYELIERYGGIHPEDAGHLACALIAAGCRIVEPPVCGASALICGIEYVCDRERQHTEPVHECTDDVGVMQWRDCDDGPTVRAWMHELEFTDA